MLGFQSELLLQQDDGPELRGVVLDVEPILLALDDSVAPAHTDVIDAHLTLMTTAQLELRLFRCDCQKMDVSGGVLVEGHRL